MISSSELRDFVSKALSIPDYTEADVRAPPHGRDPSFNQSTSSGRLERAQQGCPNLEYMVIDGGSTDESPDVIRKARLTFRSGSAATTAKAMH
jgi:hypothetical protein